MKKRALSILFLCFYLAVMLLSLTACGGGERIRGLSVEGSPVGISYNEETGLTELNLNVRTTNNNENRAIRAYKFKAIFRDENGSILTTKVYSVSEGLRPYDTNTFSYTFKESEGTAIIGRVATVDVVPTEMSLSNDAVEGTTGANIPKWGFWAWFWTIVSGILVFLFITCCIGADGDSDAIIGGVIIFLVPAILILVIYFGFVYGSGV